jgi:hypothetical protein
MAKVEILDPFGSVFASGELTPVDVPGIDESTPSAAQEFEDKFVGKRLTIDIPGGAPNVLFSIRVS